MHIDTRIVEARNQKNSGFSEYAPPLYGAGMAAVPLAIAGTVRKDSKVMKGKEPLVFGFNKWKHRPGRLTFEKWCWKFPDANVGYLPGLTGKGGTIVIDDDGGARDKIIELFGDTPGKVRTRRGNHYLYRAPKGLERFNLKALGINADVKLGNDIVVGPGSIHESGHVYAWNGCDERVIADLPLLDMRGLSDLIRGAMPPAGNQAELKARAGYRSASRELQLNDLIYGRSRCVTDPQELMAIGHKWNQSNKALGIIPLEDAQVMQIVSAVLKERETKEVENWHGRRATVKFAMDDMDKLSAFGKEGTTLAMPLLVKLRGEHGARMSRNETFALNQIAMVRDQTIPHWTKYDYQKAREILVSAGLVKIVSEGRNTRTGRTSTLYQLA